MKVSLAFLEAALWLSLFPKAVVHGQSCTTEQAVNDSCATRLDGVCNAGVSCPAGSDCIDCDPCLNQSGTDCATCTGSTDSNGNACAWCPHWDTGRHFCMSRDVAIAYSAVCDIPLGFITTCPDCTVSFSEQMFCSSSFDRVCDVGQDGDCAVDTDCFDCDPCHDYDATDCETCTSNGCSWCSKDGACWSPNLALTSQDGPVENPATRTIKVFSCEAQDFATETAQCATLAADNFFADPLYDANTWVFDAINVRPAWEAGYTGAGIGIRFNDDGVDANHPDFSSKFDVTSSCQIYQSPLPVPEDDYSHGTVGAAIAAASANDACSAGIAPAATVSACSVIGVENPSPEAENQSFLYTNMETMDVSNNSWGATTCERVRRNLRRLQTTCPFLPEAPPCQADSECAGVNWGVPGSQSFECEEEIIEYCENGFDFEADELACTEFLDLFADCNYIVLDGEQESIVRGVTEGRQGRGVVYVFSSGNFHQKGETTNGQSYFRNTRFVMNVGAVGKDNVVSTYSARGTGLFVVAPGGDREFWGNHVVALNGGGCKESGVGTSFAAPVVSGVVALILQANSELSYRDVQGIIATTAIRVNPTDDSWVTNGAGIAHSNEYGFGLVDAGAAVVAAESWELYSEERWNLARSGLVNLPLPDDPSPGPVTSIITMDAPTEFVMESVNLYVKLSHSSRGDLQITLTSPSGTTSIVHPWGRPENGNSGGFWKFTTWKNFGESATGAWTLSIEDRRAGDVFFCNDNAAYSFVFPGTTIDVNCEVLDSIRFCQSGGTFLGGRDLSGPDDPFLADADGTTPADACCSCGGGSTCIDDFNYVLPYDPGNGEIIEVTCALLERNEFCQGGSATLFFDGIPVSGPDDPQLAVDGVTPADACCACGGGLTQSTVPDILEEWYVVAYGRGGNASPTIAPAEGSCETEEDSLESCITNEECSTCLNVRFTSVLTEPDATCGLYQTTMCDAIYTECDACSDCIEEAFGLYECIALDFGGCDSFTCPNAQQPATVPTVAPTRTPVCETETVNVNSCITDPTCVDCLNANFDSVFADPNPTCQLFQSTMCDAVYELCDTCSDCIGEAYQFYGCLSKDRYNCTSFTCPNAPTTAPTAEPVCAAEVEDVIQCTGQTCRDCLIAAENSFLALPADEQTCSLYQTTLCQAIYTDCTTCSGCIEETEAYIDCNEKEANCPFFSCECEAKLVTMNECASPECLSCMEIAYNSVFGGQSDASCASFELNICRAVEDCDACSGCTQEVEDYWTCWALEACDSFQCTTPAPTTSPTQPQTDNPTVSPSLPAPSPPPVNRDLTSGALAIWTTVAMGLTVVCSALAHLGWVY